MKQESETKIMVDPAIGSDKETVSVWKFNGNGTKELLYEEDAYKLRANYTDYCKETGQTLEEFMSDAVMYGELELMLGNCFAHFCDVNENGERDKKYTEYLTTSGNINFFVDRELTDDEKFICALLSCYAGEYGLTCKILSQLYSWSRHKCYKVAKRIKHKYVCTLICEDREGYFGKGWMLDHEMYTAINNYVHQVKERQKSAM